MLFLRIHKPQTDTEWGIEKITQEETSQTLQFTQISYHIGPDELDV